MGLLADFKAKRAVKAAAKAHNAALVIWREDFETLKRIITVFTAASRGAFLSV
jgi:hypothetical protein